MKCFMKLTAISVQSKMYYRTSFLMNLFTPVVLLVGQYLLWGSLYRAQGGADIGGMARREMFSYILLAFALNNLLTWATENSLSREIRTGTVVTRCVRPVAFLQQTLAEMTGSLLPQGVVNFLVVMVGFVCFRTFLAWPSFGNVLRFLPCVILATFLRMMLTEVVSLLCFFTTSHLGISWTRQALFQFFSGALIPVSMFPGLLKTVTYLTPFPYMLQAPIAVCLGQEIPVPYGGILLLQTVWSLLLLGLHCLIYRRVRRNLSIAGG